MLFSNEITSFLFFCYKSLLVYLVFRVYKEILYLILEFFSTVKRISFYKVFTCFEDFEKIYGKFVFF